MYARGMTTREIQGLDGHKDMLRLWTSANEGAKFWLQVLTELRNRGVKDIFMACVDGLKGFPQAIESVFPQGQVQLCIVHLVRASLNYVDWRERKSARRWRRSSRGCSPPRRATRRCRSSTSREAADGRHDLLGRPAAGFRT